MAKTDFKMADYNKIVSAFKDQESPDPVRKSPINITYGTLDQIFKVLNEEDFSVKQVILCLPTLSKKSEDVIANIIKKPHNSMKKTMNYLRKTQMILRSYIQISQKKGKKKCLQGMWVFSAEILVSQHIL